MKLASASASPERGAPRVPDPSVRREKRSLAIACRSLRPRRKELAPIYSNRSASFLKLAKVSQALQDAERCVQLRPEWDKAHFRRAMALEANNDDDEALLELQVRTTNFSSPPA